MFSMQPVSYNPSIAKIQLSSAASLNLGRSQNGILGNGLNVWTLVTFESKNKNFSKNSKSKKGHNSCKNNLRVISLVYTYSTFYSEHIF